MHIHIKQALIIACASLESSPCSISGAPKFLVYVSTRNTHFTSVGEVYIDQGLWSSEGAPSSCQLSEALHMFFQDLYVKQPSDNAWPQHTNEQGKQQILPILLRSTQNTDV